MRYKLLREQQLNCDLNTAWDFFSSPHNLEKITPKEMQFIVLSKDNNHTIYEGKLINYTVSPILKIQMKWRTRITQVDPNISFTDFQEQGPYKYWNHFHEFLPNEKGVLIKDTITYELPFGILGTIAHQLFVKNKLNKIFKYRFEVLEKMFNRVKS